MTEENKIENSNNSLLRSISDFTTMKSGSFPIEMSMRAKALGWSSFALTDQDTMSGIENLLGKKADKGVANPICGVDLFLAFAHQPEMEGDTKTKVRLPETASAEDYAANYLPLSKMAGGRIAILAKTRKGYRSICRLLERASGRMKVPEKKGSEKSFRWKLDDQYLLFDDLLELAEDVIILTGKEGDGLLWFLYNSLPIDGEDNVDSDKNIVWEREIYALLKSFENQNKNITILIERCRNIFNGAVNFDSDFDDWLEEFANHYSCSSVATWDVRYAEKKNKTTYLLQKAQVESRSVSIDEAGMIIEEDDRQPDYFIPSPEEFAEAFRDAPSALAMSRRAGAMCDYHPTSRDPIMPITNDEDLDPEFLNYSSQDTEEERAAKRDEAAKKTLEKRSYAGLKVRLDIKAASKGPLSDEMLKTYYDRLAVELDVIISRGYADYFLIVAEFIDWSRQNGVPVGPGRGSGAGSLVAWCLQITQPDPLEFGLLFERFLNPERKSMPDFDIDFGEGRDRTLAHMVEKYGAGRVCGISNFSVLKPKSCIQDVVRICGYYNLPPVKLMDMDDFSSAFRKPAQGDLSLPEIIALSHTHLMTGEAPDLSSDHIKKETFDIFSAAWNVAGNGYTRLYKDDGEVLIDSPIHAILRSAGHLWGHLRGYGQHAAGIILLPDNVSNHLPVVRMNNSDRDCMGLCSFDMKGAERMGGVKFDFLGLNNLNIIDETLRVLRATDPDNVPDFDSIIDLDRRPDGSRYKEIYQALSDFKTQGIFQFDGGSMGEALRDVRPHRFADAVAMVALYRPGPMENIPLYAQRNRQRQDYEIKLQEAQDAGTPLPEKPVYQLSSDPIIQEVLARILDETLGIFVYQEQIMLVAMELSDYSLGEADLLRRAMGKKDREEMARQGQRFMEGALKKGMKEDAIQAVFNQMEKFADYGFNKSHAVAYAMISWRTTYLKVYHPEAFTAAVINCIDTKEALNPIISEMREFGVNILPPDINRSGFDASLEMDPKTGRYSVRPGLGRLGGTKAGAQNLLDEREANGPYKSLRDFGLRIRPVQGCGTRVVETLAWVGALDSLDAGVDKKPNVIGEGRPIMDWDGVAMPNRRMRELLVRFLLKKKAPKETNTNQIELFAIEEKDHWAWPEKIAELDIPDAAKNESDGHLLNELADYPYTDRKMKAFEKLHFFERYSQEEELSYMAERFNLPVRIPGVYIEFLRSVQIGQETHLPTQYDGLDMLSGVAVAGRIEFVNVRGKDLSVEISDDRDRHRYVSVFNISNLGNVKKYLDDAHKKGHFIVFPNCDVSESYDGGKRRFCTIKCFSPSRIMTFDEYALKYMEHFNSDHKDGFIPASKRSDYHIFEAGSDSEYEAGLDYLNMSGISVEGDPCCQLRHAGKTIIILRFAGRRDAAYWIGHKEYDDPCWRQGMSGCYEISEDDELVMKERDARKDEMGVSNLYRSVVNKRIELEAKNFAKELSI